MKFRLLLSVAMVSLSVSQGFAQEIKPEPPLVREMLQGGWTKVAEGVLQRNETGQVETFTYGEDGLRWTARRLETRLEFLQKEYESQPTEELAVIIRNLESQLIETDQVLKSGAAAEEVVSSEEIDNCSIDYWATAAADPRTDVRGVKANATAYFHANCGWIGNTYAYAYGRATEGTLTTTKTQEDPKYSGGWLDSAASVAVPGRLDCYSEAFARTWSPQLNINYEVSDYNYDCPDVTPAVTASINGPYDVYLDDYYNPCQNVTWYASATGGSGVYSYQWYYNGGTTVVGTGSSFSQTYCSGQVVEVRVVATDTSSPAKSDDATFTTWIYYENSCSSNCTCLQSEDPWRPETNESPYRPLCP